MTDLAEHVNTEEGTTDTGDFSVNHAACRLCFPKPKKGDTVRAICGETKTFTREPRLGKPPTANTCVVCLGLLPSHLETRHGMVIK